MSRTSRTLLDGKRETLPIDAEGQILNCLSHGFRSVHSDGEFGKGAARAVPAEWKIALKLGVDGVLAVTHVQSEAGRRRRRRYSGRGAHSNAGRRRDAA